MVVESPHALPDYLAVTEVAGDTVTREQVERICQRYYWAAEYCAGAQALECACGTGQGVPFLAQQAQRYWAGDLSAPILQVAARHPGNRRHLLQFAAERLPFGDAAFDVVILFEALYYLKQPAAFIRDCARVLRPGGRVLVATANKDLYDFNPSPYSRQYCGVPELRSLFEEEDFTVRMFGGFPTSALSFRQQVTRPLKRVAVSLGVMPRSMAGKKLLKRLVFGELVPMPDAISATTTRCAAPVSIASDRIDVIHKVLYCEATLAGGR